ncbi:MAG: hypothetical protein AAF266_00275 [Planctomycetota bacterium]
MTQDEINDAEWKDATNWTWGIYRSERDTRVWVAKKPKWTGWTLNFAHTVAYWWLFVLLMPGVIVAILAIVVASNR